MLVVPCPCGVKLRVKDEVAGHRVKCPKCGVVMRAPQPGGGVAPATPNAARRSDPQRVPQPVARSKPAPAANDAPAPLDLLEQLSAGEPAMDLAPLPVAPVERAAEMGYARDPNPPGGLPGRISAVQEAISSPKRGFWADLLRAFIYPVAGAGNAVNCLIIVALAILSYFCRFGVFALLGRLAIYGWTASVFMNVVGETAAGNEDMPGITMEDGWYEDIVKPAFRFACTFVLAMAPTIAYWILSAQGVIPESDVLLITWMALGVLLWPMFVLMISLGVGSMLVRIDLIVLTLVRTLAPYLAICLLLLGVFLLRAVFTFGLIFAAPAPAPGRILPGAFELLGLPILVEIVGTYLALVSMRLIGLYYLHFKKRFAFKLE